MTAIEISQGDLAGRQRRAAAELGRDPGRPPRPAVYQLDGRSGRVGCRPGTSAAWPRRARHARYSRAWRLALELEEYRDQEMSGGTAWLHAAVRRHQVRVRLSATVFPDYDAED